MKYARTLGLLQRFLLCWVPDVGGSFRSPLCRAFAVCRLHALFRVHAIKRCVVARCGERRWAAFLQDISRGLLIPCELADTVHTVGAMGLLTDCRSATQECQYAVASASRSRQGISFACTPALLRSCFRRVIIKTMRIVMIVTSQYERQSISRISEPSQGWTWGCHIRVFSFGPSSKPLCRIHVLRAVQKS